MISLNTAFIDQVHARLIEHAEAQQWSLLIDPTLHDPLETLSANLDAPLAQHRLPATRWPVHARPYLVAAASPRDAERLLSASFALACEEIRSARHRCICAWLHTGPDPENRENAARHLARAMVVRREGPGQPFMFRFFDPRLSSGIALTLKAEGWNALAGPLAGRWWTLDPAHGAVRLGEATPTTPPRPLPLILSHDEHREISILGWVNRVTAALPAWQLPETSSAGDIRYIVRNALAEGCDSDTDMLTFAHASLVHHPGFHRHPRIRDARRHDVTGEPQASYASIIEAVTSDEWAEIRRWAASEEAPMLATSPTS